MLSSALTEEIVSLPLPPSLHLSTSSSLSCCPLLLLADMSLAARSCWPLKPVNTTSSQYASAVTVTKDNAKGRGKGMLWSSTQVAFLACSTEIIQAVMAGNTQTQKVAHGDDGDE